MSQKLTKNEIRDVRGYLEAGKALPDKYRFLLFEEKRITTEMIKDKSL